MTILAERVRHTPPANCEDGSFGPDEAFQLFDATAMQYMNVSGDEFLRRWDAGVYCNGEERKRAMRVALLIPMIRSTSARKKPR